MKVTREKVTGGSGSSDAERALRYRARKRDGKFMASVEFDDDVIAMLAAGTKIAIETLRRDRAQLGNADRTVTAAAKAGIAVETIDNYGSGLAGTAAVLHGTAHGHTTIAEGKNIRWRVRVNKGLDWPARYATLTHELAHIYYGHLGGDPKDRWPNRATLFLTHGQRELEAEAAAYIVCARAGIETRSADYLALHVAPDDLEIISVFAILAAANRIEARSDRATST